jgi:hypothetical protein
MTVLGLALQANGKYYSRPMETEFGGRFAAARRRALLGFACMAALSVGVTSHADVFFDVPEAANFELVYALTIPNAANYSTAAVPYSTDRHLAITGPVDRIAYYPELASPGGQTYLAGYDLMADTWFQAIPAPLP